MWFHSGVYFSFLDLCIRIILSLQLKYRVSKVQLFILSCIKFFLTIILVAKAKKWVYVFKKKRKKK